jgi:hypothetical protein
VQGGSQEFVTAGSALVAELLARFGRVRIRARGTSMLPTIQAGDVLDIQSCSADQVLDGDILLVNRAGALRAHRMVSGSGCNARSVVTRGDAHWCPDDAVDGSEVLGRVVRVTRGNSGTDVSLDCSVRDRLRGLAQSELTCIVVPVRRVLFRIARAALFSVR